MLDLSVGTENGRAVKIGGRRRVSDEMILGSDTRFTYGA
jgi:hypothetical protein